MKTTIDLETQEGRPYRVSVDVVHTDARRIGELFPHIVVMDTRWSLDVASFDDLVCAVSALTPTITKAALRDALLAVPSALGEALGGGK